MTGSGSPGRPLEAGSPLSLRLRLLDHQLVGCEAEMLGNVDDIALEDQDGELVAIGVLRGPGAWAHRQPGVLGRWGRAVWRRLERDEDPRPLVLPLDHVLGVGSAVHVDPWAEEYLAASDHLELWLRRRVVGRLPGARGGEHRFGGDLAAHPGDEPGPALAADAHLLSDLLGLSVIRADGSSAGRVVEVRARQRTEMDSRVGPLVVSSLVHGPRRLGGELGYRDDPAMAPFLLGRTLRWWHRHDEETAWEAVRSVDWSTGRVILRA